MRFRILIKIVAALALLSGCATYDPALITNSTELTAPYRLDAGDQMRIVVFGQDNLSNTYTVDKAGAISFPLIGSVSVRGKTPTEVERTIERHDVHWVRGLVWWLEIDGERIGWCLVRTASDRELAKVAIVPETLEATTLRTT